MPLLSNLSIWQNIALIKQFHENMEAAKAHELVVEILSSLGLEHIAGKRWYHLNEDELFTAKLVRAAMLHEAEILIDRPFAMLRNKKSIKSVLETLALLDKHFVKCNILDYDWNKVRYGENCE